MMAQTGVCGVSKAQASSEMTFSVPFISSSFDESPASG